jgi:hypothetical protein
VDRVRRDALLKRVGDVGRRQNNLTLVTLEEFFEGNDDGGSIWCNLPSAPEPDAVYRILRSIRERSDVADVRVMVTQYDGGDDEWPFSDTVYFVTAASAENVVSWLGEDCAPDEASILTTVQSGGPLTIPQGHKVVACWWD